MYNYNYQKINGQFHAQWKIRIYELVNPAVNHYVLVNTMIIDGKSVEEA